jgi:D-aminopeptidase
VTTAAGTFTVGVLVQANYGARDTLTIAGVPVGAALAGALPIFADAADRSIEKGSEGSILIVVATDAPVSPLILRSMATRAVLGLARCGGLANPGSGDFVLAVGTRALEADGRGLLDAPVLHPYAAAELYAGTVQAVEESIVNALVAGRTTTGKLGTAHGLPHDRLVELLRAHGRLADDAERRWREPRGS